MSAPMDFSKIDDRDWFLQNLINIVNGQDIEFGVTLNVAGFLVSGQLVSGHKYFAAFGAELGSTWNDPKARRDIEQAYERFGDLYRGAGNEQAVAPPNYVHLKDARFFNTAGEPVPASTGIWWRGRVSEVAGFFMGALQQ